MTRPIKFRAWDSVEKQMLYASLYDFEKPGSLGGQIPYVREGKVYYFSTWRKPLMQFTGLLDKNRKEIYEGDILRHNFSPGREETFVLYPAVSFLDMWAQLRIKRYGRIETPALTDLNDELEIIGNIYENPDLLTPQ